MQRTAECTIAARRADMQNKSMQLKEIDHRASRVKARRAKYREIQDWQERSPQAKEVGGSRLPGTGVCELPHNSLEPKLS